MAGKILLPQIGPARIGWSNPITRKLAVVSQPGLSFPRQRNLVDQAAAIFDGVSSKRIEKLGTAGYISGSVGSRIGFSAPASSGDMAIITVAVPGSTASGQTFAGVFNTTGGSAVGNYLSIESGPVYSALSTDGANWNAASGRAPVAGELVVLGANFTASGGRSLYINGSLAGSSPTARNPTGMNEFLVGCYHGGSGSGYLSPLTGSVLLSLLFLRTLADAEHASIAAQLGQIYQAGYSPLLRPATAAPPQLLSPTGQLAGSTWIASNGGALYTCVDETVADEADYTYTTTPGTWEEFTFPTGGAVSAAGGHVRYRIPAGSGAVTAELRQGTTVLQTWGPHTLTGSLQAFDQTITASTSDSTDLRVRFTAS